MCKKTIESLLESGGFFYGFIPGELMPAMFNYLL